MLNVFVIKSLKRKSNLAAKSDIDLSNQSQTPKHKFVPLRSRKLVHFQKNTAQEVNNKECSILAKQNSLSCKVTKVENQQIESRVSGCGTVGRAVASDFRDPWFESQHR